MTSTLHLLSFVCTIITTFSLMPCYMFTDNKFHWGRHKSSFFFFNFYLFIYLFIHSFMAVLGLRFCARAFSSCGKWGPLFFIAVRGPLTVAASLVAEHRLQTRRLSNCGSRAWLLRGMWDLPRPGLEPVSPALAGRFSTTVPPGKPKSSFFFFFFFVFLQKPNILLLQSGVDVSLHHCILCLPCFLLLFPASHLCCSKHIFQ